MINLIPNQEKKKMVQNFYFRLMTMFLAVTAVSFFVATLVILPAYSLSLTQKNAITQKLAAQKELPVFKSNQEVLATVRDINDQLILLDKANTEKFVVSEKIIDALLSQKMSDIKISQIAYENDFLKGKSVSVQGSAPSRERLLIFRQRLENSPLFESVDLPISNFIKGTNIRFSLNLIPKQDMINLEKNNEN